MQELLQWLSTLAVLFGLGLSVGANPALYGATLDLLARPVRAAPRLIAMLGGLILGASVLFALFHVFNPTHLVDRVRGGVEAAALNRIVDLAAGVVLTLLALVLILWVLRVRKLPEKEDAPRSYPEAAGATGEPTAARQTTEPRTQFLSYFSIGLSGAVIGFTPLPALYLTARMTSELSSDWVLRLTAFAVFLVALAGPFVLLALVWRKFPGVTNGITERYSRVLAWDWRLAAAALCSIMGLVCFALAVFLGH